MIYAAKHILLQPTQLTKLLFFWRAAGACVAATEFVKLKAIYQ